MRRRLIVSVCALTAALVSGSGLALAGGWAMTSVDSAPEEIVAGRTYTVEYTVRQHGDKPVAVDDTFIQITSVATGEQVRFPGQVTGDVGQYAAEMTVPAEGEWTWQVSQGWFGMQELGSLQVQESGAAGPVWTSTTTRVVLPAAALLAALLLAIQLVWFWRGRRADERGYDPLPGVVSGD